MHGIIFAELKKFVDTKFGGSTWTTLLSSAGLTGNVYMPIQEYPDADALALVGAASKATGKPAGAILEDFGEFIAPDLIRMYGSLLDPTWKTLDTIEHTEETIHRVVRLKNPGAKPPELVCARPSPKQVVITYGSARKMCGVAKGIVRGLAKHYGESVTVDERSCMLNGAPRCVIAVSQS